ncbi:DUF547 domain-containing protein [Ichthyenterobacterium sp. W332]|uniref:DUF547 domain-containing protein n=1 Tax=Microcosmobacter mediterraneus TaxID=3075607 RepID=A0ABU2YK16_9FLAO|nr:DUF547 domain-containing protein [Ichthyenterobacterium sp. W332]MDT0558517.1 DUF547 domain-containing protein [Ichthyenterobacterium sp. W332]
MRTIITALILLVSFNVLAQDLDMFLKKTDAFLKQHVTDGKVAYSKIYENTSELDELIVFAKSIKVSESSPKKYQAFWINAYNIFVIKGIVDHYPIKSPLDKTGFFDKTKYNIGDKSVTLNDIENKLLRAKFSDPRFHFVLVCGAVGCPPLINNAYLPSTLNDQLDTQTKLALNGDFIKVNTKRKRVSGSEILKWYKEDFVQNGSEIDFINTYREEKIPTDFKLSYFSYNWNLNKQ